MKRIDIHAVTGMKVLFGAPRGSEMFAKLIEHISPEPAKPEPIFLDFEKIEVATASYLRESVLAFRDFVRGRRSMFTSSSQTQMTQFAKNSFYS